MEPYRIILVDDHALVRQGIKKILSENPQLEVIGEGADGQEALELIEKSPPDLAILDIKMPRMSGLEAARRIKARQPDVKILMLTMHREAEYLRQAREIGVEGYVLKEDIDQMLFDAIETIRSGQTFVSPSAGK